MSFINECQFSSFCCCIYRALFDRPSRLDKMALRYTERLCHLTKRIQEARKEMDEETLKVALSEYEMDLDKYIPILMQQAKIYWDAKNYRQVCQTLVDAFTVGDK